MLVYILALDACLLYRCMLAKRISNIFYESPLQQALTGINCLHSTSSDNLICYVALSSLPDLQVLHLLQKSAKAGMYEYGLPKSASLSVMYCLCLSIPYDSSQP